MRRIPWFIVLFLFSAACRAQQAKEPVSLFLSARPDILITVSEHPTTADVVEVTPQAADYPPELLNQQILQLGKELGSNARGLQFYKYNAGGGKDPKFDFLRASFAVDGIIEREAGVLRLQPIARAFAGAPEPHTIKTIEVIFEDEQPNDRTLRKYNSSSIRLEAITSTSPKNIEYRIQLQVQDPSKITIPEKLEPKAEEPPKTEKKVNTTLIVVLFALASIAAGALVYFAMLRGSGHKGGEAPPKSKVTK